LRRGIEPASAQLDLETSTARFNGANGAQIQVPIVLLGSFSRAPRTWAWAFSNPSVPPNGARRCRETLDRVSPRDMWEISTPQFATDEPSCAALVAVVARSVSATGVLRFSHPDGLIYVLVDG
jgi:hypothetical protein